MADESTKTRRKPTTRSPSYPAIPLGEALERARTIYENESDNPAPINAILAHWGYSPGSGAGLVQVAALKKFGLSTDLGTGDKRQARLSDEALRILLDERPDPGEREELIQSAALKPLIHAELWEKYGSTLPSDATLKHYLRLDRGFSDRGVSELIPEFRSTLTFAGLVEGDTMSSPDDEAPAAGAGAGKMNAGAVLAPPQSRSVQLPLSGGKWATLQASFPVTEEDWTLMLAVLSAMKPGLIAEDESYEADDPEA